MKTVEISPAQFPFFSPPHAARADVASMDSHKDFEEKALAVSKADAAVAIERAATENAYSLVGIGGLRKTVRMTRETRRKTV